MLICFALSALGCLSEDITCNESLKAAILELRTQRVNGNINKNLHKALQNME